MLAPPPHTAHKCRETLRQINGYLDGDIEDELCKEIELHMEKCPDCQLVVDTLSKTIRFYHSLASTQVDLPQDVEQRLMSCLNLPV